MPARERARRGGAATAALHAPLGVATAALRAAPGVAMCPTRRSSRGAAVVAGDRVGYGGAMSSAASRGAPGAGPTRPAAAGAGAAPAGRAAARLCLALAAALLLAHFASFDLGRPITTDIRYSMYFSARTAAGDVPFRDFFENRTPLSLYSGAAFLRLGEALGADPLVAIRVGCLTLAALAGLVLFAIQRTLAGGDCVAAIAALLPYLGFTLLAVMPSIGIFPKLLMSLFGPLAALLAARERWVLAGASAALAALDWQIGVFAALAVFAASVLTRHEVRLAWLRVVAGGVAVAAAVVAYLALHGALEAAIQQVVLSSFVRGSTSMRGSMIGRLAHVTRVAAAGCPGHLWLAAVGIAGMAILPVVWWRGRGTERARLSCALAVYHYGVVAFSWLDFQKFGDLYILLQSLGFFAGLAFALAAVLARAAGERVALARGGDAARRDRAARGRRIAAAVAVVVLALVVRPSILHPHVALQTRGARLDTTLAGQRAVAEDLATRFAGKRLGIIGPSELFFLARTTNALPLVYWNAATWAFYRSGPDEDLRDTLLRVIREARLDGVIYPDEVLGEEPRLNDEFAPLEVRSPGGDYGVTVLVRR